MRSLNRFKPPGANLSMQDQSLSNRLLSHAETKGLRKDVLRPLHDSFERSLWAFWGTHPAAVSGPREWANRELFEAVKPSLEQSFTACRDLANKAEDGSRSSQNQVRRGCAKVSI